MHSLKMFVTSYFFLVTFVSITFCLPSQHLSKRFPSPGVEPSAGCNQCKSSLTFAGKEAQKYVVGTNIPTLPFKTKQSWAGNIKFPNTATTKDASLFFWMWGKDAIDPGRDLIIWMNGGPGCASLLGALSENGPFLINGGQPRPNPYSWTNAANILYISQPVGVSFTTGSTSNSNEDQISEQLALWLAEFFKVFPELLQFNIFITGESYMGEMFPYQIQAIKRNPLTSKLFIRGGMLIAPAFSDFSAQIQAPTYQFVKDHQKQLQFSDEEVASIKAESDKCNLTNFIPTYLKYPPQGRLPVVSPNCDPFDLYQDIAKKHNSMFDYYNINRNKETGDGQQTAAERFLNDVNVQNYIHAPHQKFEMCKDVFSQGNLDQSDAGDSTPSYAHSLFAQMIEFCGKFVIMAGALDGLVLSEGVKLALQNLTWNGGQGFRAPPSIPLYDLEGQQKAISTIEERGLRLVIVSDSGHMVPRDSPSFSLNAIFALLGHPGGTWHK